MFFILKLNKEEIFLTLCRGRKMKNKFGDNYSGTIKEVANSLFSSKNCKFLKQKFCDFC